MQEQQLWRLIAGKLTGEASPKEMQVLSEYLSVNRQLSNCVDSLTIFWQLPVSAGEQMPELAFERLLQRIQAD